VIMLVVCEHLDCGLVVYAYVDGSVWGGRRGGDEVEAFVYCV
jgi:hypothetical protein